ncbi:hypothetical protein BEL04_17800 [Mucilaginibacter sp. PPCGB 2223]|uniref:HAD domain-containing protein n=1 Tax=Mucilaginibacter sp. PPCGB 2223 TaxID=1886027 RepID=UPI0008241AB0|nr:HAD domain-containing protein [Mucilaginibacter sp. PPCGB 2223]OCX51861.1 hypothetical protein BEL04_17800 [Mucilaginibacter sp. PPCGB 2223]
MLILLDIDGVMLPANSWSKPEILPDGFPMFNSRSIRALHKIITETNASLLLTTSHKNNYTIRQWHSIFKVRGINAEMIDRLASDSLEDSRADEILSWYRTQHIPNEEFVILDDDKRLSELPAHIKNNLVLTSASIGLTDELADNAITILNRQRADSRTNG